MKMRDRQWTPPRLQSMSLLGQEKSGETSKCRELATNYVDPSFLSVCMGPHETSSSPDSTKTTS